MPRRVALYGVDQPGTDSYGKRCLIARRLVERGVRFVQIFVESQIWDTHSKNAEGTRACCEQTDRPIAGLIKDLKRRGLLDQVLVVWCGEFGRTPVSQSGDGRDHHKQGFSVWLAGGGIRGGQVYGATDELGYHAVENRVMVADLHATILHLLGLDHRKVTYPVHGRDRTPDRRLRSQGAHAAASLKQDQESPLEHSKNRGMLRPQVHFKGA